MSLSLSKCCHAARCLSIIMLYKCRGASIKEFTWSFYFFCKFLFEYSKMIIPHNEINQ